MDAGFESVLSVVQRDFTAFMQQSHKVRFTLSHEDIDEVRKQFYETERLKAVVDSGIMRLKKFLFWERRECEQQKMKKEIDRIYFPTQHAMTKLQKRFRQYLYDRQPKAFPPGERFALTDYHTLLKPWSVLDGTLEQPGLARKVEEFLVLAAQTEQTLGTAQSQRLRVDHERMKDRLQVLRYKRLGLDSLIAYHSADFSLPPLLKKWLRALPASLAAREQRLSSEFLTLTSVSTKELSTV